MIKAEESLNGEMSVILNRLIGGFYCFDSFSHKMYVFICSVSIKCLLFLLLWITVLNDFFKKLTDMSFHLKITTNHSCPLLVSPLQFQIFFHERIHEPWVFFFLFSPFYCFTLSSGSLRSFAETSW